MKNQDGTLTRWRVLGLAVAGLLAIVPHLPGQSQPLQIVTDTLPNATTGVAYLQQLVVSGGACTGNGVATYSIDAGALPAGLSIVSPASVKQWSVQGVPNAAGVFQFTLHLTWTHVRTTPFDTACVDEAVKAFSMTVAQGSGGGGGGGGGQGPWTVDRPQVSTTYHLGRFPPSPEMVKVMAPANANIPYTVQAATFSGGSWLSVTPLSGTTPALLSLSFSISGMQAGVYTGTVTVQAGGGQATIGVTLTVVTDPMLVLQASPTSFMFSSVTGGPAPLPQTLTVSVAGDAVIFQADVSMSGQPIAPWLQVTPSAAATQAKLTVSVVPKNLMPGTYNGAITVRVPSVPASAQTIPVTFIVQAPPLVPTIAQNGVVNAAGLSAAIAPGTWVSIFGANLSPTTRAWLGGDFVGGKLPFALDGVSVTINGKAAAVAFISPTQINVLTPDDTTTGLVPVQVTSPSGTGSSALALEQTIAPALFQLPSGSTLYVAGTHADGSYLAGSRLVQQGIAGTPAKPGETIVIYGTGFGITQPPISATALVPSPLALANPQDLRVRIGGMNADISFAGLVAPGLYQFNVVVPQVADGDQSVVVELRGLLTRADLMLTVQH